MKQFRAIGLMSGTSMDGIDAAVIDTDGNTHLTVGPHASTRYPPELRRRLLRLPANDVDMASVEREVRVAEGLGWMGDAIEAQRLRTWR